jgi:hypothetical protein
MLACLVLDILRVFDSRLNPPRPPLGTKKRRDR